MPSLVWSRNSSDRIEVVTRMRSFMVVLSLASTILLVAPRLEAEPFAPVSAGCPTSETTCAAVQGTATDVPEPASLVLLGLGLFGAGVATRRRA